MKINIPVPVAELFDKISILQIKQNYINDKKSLKHIKKELELLIDIVKSKNINSFLESKLYNQLKNENESLWHICEARRISEQKNIFDDDFIEQSRLEYKTNDKRAKLKLKINQYFDSEIVEVKSYKNNLERF